MSLVGDVILAARELMTDSPPQLGPPNLLSVTPVIDANGNFPTALIVTCRATIVTKWGETLPSSQELSTSTLTGGQNAVDVVVGPIPLEAVAVRIYFTTGPLGSEGNYQQFTSLTPSVVSQTFRITYSLTVNPTVSAGVPLRSTAYLPDVDGSAVGAFAAYRWLNEGLRAAAGYANGGIPDFGGVGSVNAQPIYNLPGYWKKLDSAWYDGYPLYMARKNDVFRKGPVPGTVGGILVFQASDRLIVETWPQPGRTSGQTTLAAPMAITDTTATLTSAAGFVLGFGLVQIGTEIMEYSGITSNTLVGLTRGLSGTIPAAQANGAAVTELNLLVAGYRVPSTYAVGSSGATLNLPPAWEDALKDYMLARFREAEQDGKEAVRLQKQFEGKMKAIPTNRIIAGPRQIAANAGRGAEVYPGLGGTFGGVIVR